MSAFLWVLTFALSLLVVSSSVRPSPRMCTFWLVSPITRTNEQDRRPRRARHVKRVGLSSISLHEVVNIVDDFLTGRLDLP